MQNCFAQGVSDGTYSKGWVFLLPTMENVGLKREFVIADFEL